MEELAREFKELRALFDEEPNAKSGEESGEDAADQAQLFDEGDVADD